MLIVTGTAQPANAIPHLNMHNQPVVPLPHVAALLIAGHLIQKVRLRSACLS